MIEQSVHSRRPWQIFNSHDGTCAVWDAEDFYLCERLDREDAELIVRAVNTHDDMLKALKIVGSALATRENLSNDDELFAAFSFVVAAIAKAEGR